jgi:endogenous inhibitor of DNA gyrase (YacG/DUF329 family)
MATMRCSICDKKFDTKKSPAMPFCSDRCRLIDLGRWLNEDYGMPAGPSDEDGEREAEEH